MHKAAGHGYGVLTKTPELVREEIEGMMAEAVAAAKDKSAHVLDVREWDNYVKGRMADSMWCPIFPLEDDSLAEAMGTYAKENLSDGQKIYIICNSGKRGAEKVVLFPLLCYLFRLLLPEKEMRLETHFLVSLFVCIIGLLTTVNGNVTYPAVDEPTNWRALGFAFGLFLVLFVLGALWNRIKWIVLQKRNARKKHSAQPRTVINSKKS